MDSQADNADGISSKHNWSTDEDAALVAIIVSMKEDQNHMQGSKFCSGHLGVIEKKMQENLLGCRLKGIPHIHSRLKTLGKNWPTVHDMVYGTNTSGFSWDDDRQLVSHPDAKLFRYKPFPYLADLMKVWGKDRATGAEARDAKDINETADEDLDGLDGLGNSGKNQTPPGQHSSDDMTQPPPTDCVAASTSRKRKRTSPSNDVIEGFKEVNGLTDDLLVHTHLRLSGDLVMLVAFFSLEERLKLRCLQQING
ncbi:Myb/SANT-like domain containing protein [Senna tora]|uniref:Myb/SANT-like domain containing protein n=1 Tax=Senna tora TaxID=362788 RepID=A0A834W6V8_9FABA|nr:Myb/SANT-like domain containing protein [Senna tora]